MNDHELLTLAARAALRGMGDVEPNPMVGAVISRDGVVLGIGHHRQFGGLHAEREAIANARACGHDLRGATIHVTLEPCSHFGKQPPCVDAVLQAGFSRVVMARRDPNAVSSGGAEKLRARGVQVEEVPHELAMAMSAAFVQRVAPQPGRNGLPWVIGKWAQTFDGRLTTREGEPRWISCAASRKRVHRLRSMVDAIVTGIGTVLADDPLLTARDVARVRRRARRVVLDGQLRTPIASRVVQTAQEWPTVVITSRDVLGSPQGQARRFELEDRGVVVHGVDADRHGRPGARQALALLAAEYSCTTVMVESGEILLGELFEMDLIDQALVHIAPEAMRDDQDRAMRRGQDAPTLAMARHFHLLRQHRIGTDIEMLLGRAE
jgi:diaminohydroxyphosphoribosylaminopyrimidine deaminase/5-amino-6-(5-phosphoribosylamino)uracil reductase